MSAPIVMLDKSTRAVVERLVDALTSLIRAHYVPHWPYKPHDELIAEASKLLEQPEWVRVSDALPVVPEGDDFADVWVVVNGVVQKDAYALQPENTPEGDCTLSAEPDFCASGVTHWRYAEPTPQPPETSK